jgi:hypothetical protein
VLDLFGGRTRARTWDPLIKSQRDPDTWARHDPENGKLTQLASLWNHRVYSIFAAK